MIMIELYSQSALQGTRNVPYYMHVQVFVVTYGPGSTFQMTPHLMFLPRE
jgi:hypothetical protein